MANNFRGSTAVVGVGRTPWYGRGGAPESEKKLALRAIVAAAEDAGIDPRDIDGFVSYGGERSSGHSLMAALGTRELRFSALIWTHGGGIPGAIGVAATGIFSGQADIVAVYRSMAEAPGEPRLVSMGRPGESNYGSQSLVNGMDSPMMYFAMGGTRLMEHDGVPREALRAFSRASYHHANRNPNAYGKNVVLTEEDYDASRWISEPLHLFDCSRQNDAGIAIILVSARRAQEYRQKPAYVLSAPMGRYTEGYGFEGRTPEMRMTAGFRSVGNRLWAESGYQPNDIDVAQIYTNFTGAAINALIDLGFCSYEDAGEFFRFENLIAPNGKLPINTAGGDLADGFLHGMGNVPETVNQLRGTSPNQVPEARLSLMVGGPNDAMVSALLLGSEETL